MNAEHLSRRLVVICAVLGVVAWTAVVHSRVQPFFLVASVFCAGWLLTSALALGSERMPALLRFRTTDAFVGIVTALVLFVGARAVLWALTGGLTDVLREPVARVYGAFGGGSVAVAFALMWVIAPAEELFWRGLVLELLGRAGLRPATAVLAMAVASSVVLLCFGEPVLALAAFPTSIIWGALVVWRGSLWPALISHSVWDLLIFVVAPAV